MNRIKYFPLLFLMICAFGNILNAQYSDFIFPKGTSLSYLEEFKNKNSIPFDFPDDTNAVSRYVINNRLYITRNQSTVRKIFLHQFNQVNRESRIEIKCGSFAEYQEIGVVFGYSKYENEEPSYYLIKYYPKGDEYRLLKYEKGVPKELGFQKRNPPDKEDPLQIIELKILRDSANHLVFKNETNNELFKNLILNEKEIDGKFGFFVSGNGTAFIEKIMAYSIGSRRINLDLLEDYTYQEPTRLSNEINTQDDEVNPIMYKGTLYFTRSNQEDESIYGYQIKSKKLKKLDSINTLKPNAILSITSSGKVLLNGNYDSTFQLYEGQLKNNEVINIRKLEMEGIPKLSPKISGCFSEDGNTIILSFKETVFRDEGGLWSVKRLKGNKFSQFTKKFEHITLPNGEFPYLSKDGKYLYFSSKSLLGYSGSNPNSFDIFKAELFPQKSKVIKYQNFINLGNEINTDGDEISCSEDDSMIYFARNIDGQYDIYSTKKQLKPDSTRKIIELLKPLNPYRSLEFNKDISILNKIEKLPLKNNYSIYLYDNDQIDGDSISLFINNQPILKNYGLTSQKIKIPFIFDKPGFYFFQLISNSDGSIPPNTGVLEFQSEKETKSFYYNNSLDKQKGFFIEVR